MTARHYGDACLAGVDAPAEVMARQARETLYGVRFDTLVGTGMSGSLVIPVLARELGKDWLIVRKPGDSHHHGNEIAQGTLGDRWLFVDDGIGTGRTVRRITGLISRLNPDTTFAGAYLYGDHGYGFHGPSYYEPGELETLLRGLSGQEGYDDRLRRLLDSLS